MADVNRGNRPLSPHLTIYRPQWTSASSIMVRITGIALFVLIALPIFWLLAAATSDGAFACIDWIMRSWLGNLALLGMVWAAFYHMLGRLRHVIWDFGYCLDVKTSELMGKGMFVVATVLTVIVMIISLAC